MNIFCVLFGHLWCNSCQCARCGEGRNENHQVEGCTCMNCGEPIHNWFIKGWSFDGDRYTFEKECVRCREKIRSTEHVPFDKLLLGKQLPLS